MYECKGKKNRTIDHIDEGGVLKRYQVKMTDAEVKRFTHGWRGTVDVYNMSRIERLSKGLPNHAERKMMVRSPYFKAMVGEDWYKKNIGV